MAVKKKWKKILYEDQGVPDNYVDSSFLDEMKKNLYTRTYSYWSVVKNSGEVTQQISSLCLFVVIYIYMNNQKLSPQLLVVVMVAVTMAGYLIKLYTDRLIGIKHPQRTVLDDLKTAVIFTGFSFGLSPVLVSLTETISTDTIYAMTTVMLMANLVFHDYGASAAMVSEALSLNAGIFASVCLASRLHTTWHAFATVTLSLLVFGLWPMLRKQMKKAIPGSQIGMTLTLCSVSAVALVTVSAVAAVLGTLLLLFITFVCPAWLISLQPYKDNIYGPWDEAVIQTK
ncbi:phosphatidylinositol N-acetylglucosaminyltransferase subunit C-like [Argopecten irradians]|uniref:phosphatidylinositol N-acetylglucosaminyltransferase subunit C-like n=1 Tax=Argopecten irradians TaxID=31199 RepID=UPI00372443A7